MTLEEKVEEALVPLVHILGLEYDGLALCGLAWGPIPLDRMYTQPWCQVCGVLFNKLTGLPPPQSHENESEP